MKDNKYILQEGEKLAHKSDQWKKVNLNSNSNNIYELYFKSKINYFCIIGNICHGLHAICSFFS